MTDQFAKKMGGKWYCTGDSQAVTHPSTNPACGCLTSEIERDRVHSTEYGRIRHSTISHAFIPSSFLKLPAPNYLDNVLNFRTETLINDTRSSLPVCSYDTFMDREWEKHHTRHVQLSLDCYFRFIIALPMGRQTKRKCYRSPKRASWTLELSLPQINLFKVVLKSLKLLMESRTCLPCPSTLRVTCRWPFQIWNNPTRELYHVTLSRDLQQHSAAASHKFAVRFSLSLGEIIPISLWFQLGAEMEMT